MLSAKNLLNAIARRLGYQIDSLEYLARLSHERGIDNWLDRRQRLMRCRHIDCVLDVGANAGQFARSLRANGYGGRIISFEPIKDPFDKLALAAEGDPLWRCENYALGDAESTAMMNVAGNSYSSSFLPMREIHAQAAPTSRYIASETVTVKRLDTVFAQLVGKDDSVHLKIDVQGFERQVLEGGVNSLPRVSMVQIEASLCSLYEGDSTICDLITWLHRFDFIPVSIEPGFSDEKTGRQFQVDVLFWRN